VHPFFQKTAFRMLLQLFRQRKTELLYAAGKRQQCKNVSLNFLNMSKSSLIITQKGLDLIQKHLEMSSNMSAFNKTHLSNDLRNATIVEEAALPDNVVTFNSYVKVLDIESKQEYKFYLVLPAHANIKTNKVSCLAPIGMALFGYQTGAEVKWEMPNGSNTYKILSVSRSHSPVSKPIAG
jgi:regulator of nucleoside diphosphate kinase